MAANITAILGAADNKLIGLLTEDEADIFIALLKRLLANSPAHGSIDVSRFAVKGSPRPSSVVGAPA